MHVMDEAEYRRFLTEGTRTGKLATTRSDGRPHVAPVWFDLDEDGTVVLTTGADSVKGKNLRRDPRVCLCVDDQTPPPLYATIQADRLPPVTTAPLTYQRSDVTVVRMTSLPPPLPERDAAVVQLVAGFRQLTSRHVACVLFADVTERD